MRAFKFLEWGNFVCIGPAAIALLSQIACSTMPITSTAAPAVTSMPSRHSNRTDELRRHHHLAENAGSLGAVRRYRPWVRQPGRVSPRQSVLRRNRRQIRQSNRSRKIHARWNDLSTRHQQWAEQPTRRTPRIRQGHLERPAIPEPGRSRGRARLHEPGHGGGFSGNAARPRHLYAQRG
jgi:hypothetical protein